MPPVGFEPKISAGERPQCYVCVCGCVCVCCVCVVCVCGVCVCVCVVVCVCSWLCVGGVRACGVCVCGVCVFVCAYIKLFVSSISESARLRIIFLRRVIKAIKTANR
jgi:hypothetical protein